MDKFYQCCVDYDYNSSGNYLKALYETRCLLESNVPYCCNIF